MWKFAPFKSFIEPARYVGRVFLHCTASDNAALEGVGLVEEVNRWHRQNGWAGIGYHFMIDKAGAIMTGRPLEMTPAAQLGRDGRGNVATIAICTHGNWHFTAESLIATRELCREIDKTYRDLGRTVTFHGHCEIDPKPCPVYGYRGLLGLDQHGHFGVGMMSEPKVVAATVGALGHGVAVERPSPRLLRSGDTGPDVLAVQHALRVPSTGRMDGDTITALFNFQKEHHLVPDCIVGPNTRAALRI